MRRLTLSLATPILFCLLLLGATRAIAEPHHSLVEISTRTAADAATLRAHLGRLDVVSAKPGSYVHLAATAKDLDLLHTLGLSWKVLEEDMETSHAYADKSSNFGIYHTYSESAAFLDSLRLLYPQVISAKFSLGQSTEGRDIWAVRVSDNPDVDEDEPEVLIDCLHHAREVMASEFGIMFAQYLAQNYGSDPEITWLLDNRELYIVPIVNPDGFVYNETTDPSGGGMWRLTRRDNGDGTFGVDPNRNYPFQWGYDNVGSSPYPGDETYRGPYAASEPEVQAMMSFINAHNFRTGNSVHTYSNLTLYPWGYTSGPTSDDAIFDAMAAVMTSRNGYTPGQPGQILYDVNGGSFDWNYGATGEHQKIFSFSNEIGGDNDGFWPPEERRQPLFEENIWPNIFLMRSAGSFVAVSDPQVTAAIPAKSVAPGDDGLLDFTIANQSAVNSTPGGDLHLQSDDPWVQFDAATRTYPAMTPMTETTLGPDAIGFSVDPACPEGHRVDFAVTVSMPEGDLTFPLYFTVGQDPAVITDEFEAGTRNWTFSGLWDLTTSSAHSPDHSLTDSPGGNYGNNSSSAATLDGQWPASSLGFWTRYDIEQGWDYGYVQISADGGPWTTLHSYTGTQSAWEYETFDLGAYYGQDIAIRFLLETDTSVVKDGWYIDDVVLLGQSSTNHIPTTPEPAIVTGLPDDGITASQAILAVENSLDADGDPLTYGFRVFSDADGTVVVAAADNIAEGNDVTSWVTPALPDGDYWWRAYAADAVDRSPLCPLTPVSINSLSPVAPLVGNTLGLKILQAVSGSGARFRVTQPAAAPVTLEIFDTRGRRVRRLTPGSLNGGAHVLVWDGKDGRGSRAASGVYLVRVKVADQQLNGRVVLLR